MSSFFDEQSLKIILWCLIGTLVLAIIITAACALYAHLSQPGADPMTHVMQHVGMKPS